MNNSTRDRAKLGRFLLAYDVVRATLRDAVKTRRVPMNRVSFKSASARLQTWNWRVPEFEDIYGWLMGFDVVPNDPAPDLNQFDRAESSRVFWSVEQKATL